MIWCVFRIRDTISVPSGHIRLIPVHACLTEVAFRRAGSIGGPDPGPASERQTVPVAGGRYRGRSRERSRDQRAAAGFLVAGLFGPGCSPVGRQQRVNASFFLFLDPRFFRAPDQAGSAQKQKNRGQGNEKQLSLRGTSPSFPPQPKIQRLLYNFQQIPSTKKDRSRSFSVQLAFVRMAFDPFLPFFR